MIRCFPGYLWAVQISGIGTLLTGINFVTTILKISAATALTIISFTLPTLGLVWRPAMPVALVVLAIAQMGVHLVFFLHITTAPTIRTTHWPSPSVY
jgi:heme/copper-type cytochrome/quinol oxidase subunit 4